MNRQYSFIIPVYNRPEETKELLHSFIELSGSIPYEIIIVEDGSIISSADVVSQFKSQLNIKYLSKENSGPGDSRNYGMMNAGGNFFIILDSDVVLPPQYLQQIDAFLKKKNVDCFGGPDAADHNFSDIQKAINFVMTSFFTTGGIRGKKKSVKSYEPRSFNMGISKKAFLETGGFGNIHPGEDPDLVIRIRKKGLPIAFIEKAYVYHKRRISWGKFYVQVNKFGKVRAILNQRYPDTASVVFWFPSLFVMGLLFSAILVFIGWYLPLMIYTVYFVLIFLASLLQDRSFRVASLSLRATLTQFFGYGLGFLKSTYYIRLLNKNPKKIFPELFFN